MRLINADALAYEILSEYGADGGTEDVNTIYGMVINAPTIQAEPVKHGEWIEDDTIQHKYFRCSNCGIGQFNWGEDNYCRNCGSKMDKGGDTE